MKHFRKLPYPYDYKSLRLFVRWFREHQMKRYITLNELNGKSPLKPGFGLELSNDTLRDIYVLLLQSIVEAKPIFVTGKICSRLK